MKLSQALLFMMLMAAGAALYSLWMNPQLPETVPTHWDFSGKPDNFGPKSSILWIMPGMILAFAVLTYILPKISPKNYEVDRFGHVYHYLMTIVAALLVVLHAAILQSASTGAFQMGRVFPVAFGLFFMLLGNVLGKVQRNFWMGIRTPWTLADERVWDQTHRAAARLWFFGGIFIAILGLLDLPAVVPLTLVFVVGLWPAVHSFLIWRRLRGGAAAT